MRFLALAVVIMTACALAACGAGRERVVSSEALSKKDYERRFAAAQERVGEEGLKRARTSSKETIAAELRAFTARRAAELLVELEPPGEVAAAHDQLVLGLRKTATNYDRTVAAFKAGDTRKARRLDAHASRSSLRVATVAGDAFRSKGYRVSLPTS
jgi:hypothetical protein